MICLNTMIDMILTLQRHCERSEAIQSFSRHAELDSASHSLSEIAGHTSATLSIQACNDVQPKIPLFWRAMGGLNHSSDFNK